jgi:hypothetical protein
MSAPSCTRQDGCVAPRFAPFRRCSRRLAAHRRRASCAAAFQFR